MIDEKKLIERLEGREKYYHECALDEIMKNGHTLDAEGYLGKEDAYGDALSIINHLAKESKDAEMLNMAQVNADYAKAILVELKRISNNGWIACTERLPESDYMCLVTVEYQSGKIAVNYGWFDKVGVCWYVGMYEFRTTNVHAWQPLPEPYSRKERKKHD